MKGDRIKKTGETLPTVEKQLLSNGTYQVRYNFLEVGATEEKPASFCYDYVDVPKDDRDIIVRAIIRDKYKCIDDEIAIINNAENNPDEYTEYQAYRALAKQVADEVR